MLTEMKCGRCNQKWDAVGANWGKLVGIRKFYNVRGDLEDSRKIRQNRRKLETIREIRESSEIRGNIYINATSNFKF